MKLQPEEPLHMFPFQFRALYSSEQLTINNRLMPDVFNLAVALETCMTMATPSVRRDAPGTSAGTT